MIKDFLLGFNWKMNPTSQIAALELMSSYLQNIPANHKVKSIIFPPDLFLSEFANFLLKNKNSSSKNLFLGSQNCSEYSEGAFTGEISPALLANTGIKYCLIGHSETRFRFKLTDIEINHKILNCFRYGVTPVLCVGYQKQSQSQGVNLDEIQTQLTIALKGVKDILDAKKTSNFPLIIAYEPIWTIGGKQAASIQDVSQTLGFIENFLATNLQIATKKVGLMYGGSVKAENIEGLITANFVNGFLIGRSSLDTKQIQQIVEKVSQKN